MTDSSPEKWVTVFLGDKGDSKTKDFKCMNCGKLLFTHDQDIVAAIEAEITDVKGNMQVLCLRCRTLYKVYRT